MKLTAKQKRVKKIVASFQEYVSTYSTQMHYEDYTDTILIDDFLYGIGIAFGEQYRGAAGFEKFKAVIRERVTPADQPADVDAEARALFYTTRNGHGWTAPEWDELAEETRQNYREFVARRAADKSTPRAE